MNAVLDPIPTSQCSALSEILLGHLRTIDPHYWPGIDGMTADVVLRFYNQVAAAGHVPGKEALLRQHPDLAVELERFFALSQSPAPKLPIDPMSPLVTGGVRAD